MENLIAGPIVIFICLILAFLGYRWYRKGNYSMVLFCIMAGGMLLRIFVFTDLFLHEWDERFHALVAKNLIRHPLKPTLYDDPVLPYDYKGWGENHIWLHKLPVPLWLMSAFMRIFGTNEIALRLPSLLLSTLGIYLVYAVGKYLFNRNIGLIAAVLYAINGLIIELAGGRVPTDHIDVHFLSFILLSVFFLIRFFESGKPFYNLFAGLSMGLALLSKFLPALIVAPIWLLLAIDSNRLNRKNTFLHFSLFLFAGLSLLALWMAYIFVRFPAEAYWETYFNFLHVTEVIDGQSGSFLYHFDTMRMTYGEIVYLPVLWFLVHLFRTGDRMRNIAIFTWFFLPYLFFSFVRTRMPAYTLFAAPALFIIIAMFYTRLSEYRSRGKIHYWAVTAIQILLIALPIRYTIERVKPFERLDRHPAWAKELKDLSRTLPPDQKTVLFNVEHPIETMFYTNCTAYRNLPEKKVLEEILDRDYRVYINQRGPVPEEIICLPGIKILNLDHN